MPTTFDAPDQILVDVPERQTLLNAALAAGIPHTHVWNSLWGSGRRIDWIGGSKKPHGGINSAAPHD